MIRWTEPHQKADEPGRVESRKARRAAQDALWRDVCRAVDQRDKGRCRCCGRRCDPDAVDMLRRGHRHHLTYRSAGGEDSTANLVLICAMCHEDEHRHRLRIEGDADIGLVFYRRDAAGSWFQTRRELSPGRVERD